MLDIDVEHALEKACPTHARRLAPVLAGSVTGLLCRARRDRSAQSSVRGKHPVEADRVRSGARRHALDAAERFARF